MIYISIINYICRKVILMPKIGFLSSITIIISFIVISLTTSCRKDLDFEISNTNLRFSKDTVFLDTIFTQSNSETYLLKVFNDSDNDISLENVYLNRRDNSSFRVNVDGLSGFEFSEIPLRAKDSLMVFVEIAVDQANNDMIEEDELVFENSNQQVKLLAMIEEATYHYPSEDEDFIFINENTVWDNNTSHVVYGTVKLAENASLSILQGSRIYFHNNSGMDIDGTLNLNGTLENPIIIRGDRHDARYDTLPKQWNSIKMNTNSMLSANYAVLKGGTYGFSLENSTANISNTQIYNMASSGIFAKNADVSAANVVIADAADACLNVENGGTYNFYFSTFANAWSSGVAGVSGPNIPVYLSNYTLDADNNEIYADFDGTFANCIFYGRSLNGIYFDPKDGANFTYALDACLIKNEDTSSHDFSAYVNDEPLFMSNIYSHHDLRLQEGSPGEDAGNANYNATVPNDILGNPRIGNPSMGAYE